MKNLKMFGIRNSFTLIIRKITFTNKEQIYDALIVCITALTFRIVNLESYPQWYCDEGTNIQLGLNMFHGQLGYSTWGPNFFPPLYNFLIGLMVTLFGNNYFIARLPGAIMGAMSCVLLFLIAKKLFNRFTGLSAALLLSVAGMYINRMALSYNGVEFFLLLTVFSYLKFRENENKKWSYLAGSSAGLAFLSSYLGIVSFLFLILQSSIDNKINKMRDGILIFILISLIYPILGSLINWRWFVYDLSYQASRSFDPRQSMYVLSLAAPYEGFTLPPYHWTLLGFISCFYVMAGIDDRKNAWSNRFLLLLLFSVLAVFFIISLWWASLIIIYPIYCLAMSLLVFDIYRARASSMVVLLISIITLPPLLLAVPLDFSYLGIYFFILVLFFLMKSVVHLTLLRKFKLFHRAKVGTKYLFVLTIMIFSGLAFFADISLVTMNAVSDQKEVVNFINSHANKNDLVAADPAICSQLRCIGIDFSHVAFFNTKKPIFLYEDAATMFSRFNMNLTLKNIKYFILDSRWHHASSSGEGEWYGKELEDSIRSWWNIFNIGDYSVYLNPTGLSLEELSFTVGWEESSFSESWNLAYEKGTIEQMQTSNGTVGLFMATSSASPKYDDYVFWRKSTGNVSLEDYPTLVMRYKVSDPSCRVVVKLLGPEDKEVGGWFIDSSPSTEYKFAVHTPTATNVSTVIVGMDSFEKPNTPYTMYIDNIGLFKIIEE